MKLHNYKIASKFGVEKWLGESLKLTPYQKEILQKDEIIRFSPYEFIEERKKVSNIWLRFTIFLMPFVWVLLFMGLPFNFLITGKWGYKYSNINWYHRWCCTVGL